MYIFIWVCMNIYGTAIGKSARVYMSTCAHVCTRASNMHPYIMPKGISAEIGIDRWMDGWMDGWMDKSVMPADTDPYLNACIPNTPATQTKRHIHTYSHGLSGSGGYACAAFPACLDLAVTGRWTWLKKEFDQVCSLRRTNERINEGRKEGMHCRWVVTSCRAAYMGFPLLGGRSSEKAEQLYSQNSLLTTMESVQAFSAEPFVRESPFQDPEKCVDGGLHGTALWPSE